MSQSPLSQGGMRKPIILKPEKHSLTPLLFQYNPGTPQWFKES